MGTVDIFVLWLHIVAATIWVGGIIFLGAVVQPVSKILIADPLERSTFMGRIGARFNLLAWSSMLILVVTGLYNLLRVSGGLVNVPQLLLKTEYGIILDAKIGFVFGMIVITAHHTLISGPKVRRLILQLSENSRRTSAELQAELGRLQNRNGFLMRMLVVFALVTLLLATLLVAPP